MASEKTGSHRATAGARLLASRYRLVERIDEGGAGEVWRARDEKLDRDVAIKLLGPDADDAFRARFADEARRAAAVVHPNVVTVFDEGRDGADAFMVMELVPGKTLREIVAERGPLPAHEVARLIRQVAAALDAAHAAGASPSRSGRSVMTATASHWRASTSRSELGGLPSRKTRLPPPSTVG